MKEIKAYLKPHKLDDVTLALHKCKGLTGMLKDLGETGLSAGSGQDVGRTT